MPRGEITENSCVPFGRKPDKGKPLCRCSDSFLRWIVQHMKDTDFHVWAYHAEKVLAGRQGKERALAEEDNLDSSADQFLRNHGYGKLARKH
jgi:hypothetical protein